MPVAKRLPITLCLLAVSACAAPSWGAELVIVNPACSATSLTQDVLKALYTGRKRSLPDGERVEILVLDGPPVHERFVADLLDSTTEQFASYWKRQVFIGQGKLPRSFDSESDLVAYVASHPGSLGYIDAATPHDKVKVLSIHE
jgi:hypothetical protein